MLLLKNILLVLVIVTTASSYAFTKTHNRSDNIFIEKEQFINTHYLQTLKFGANSLDIETKEAITELANNCPYILGNAVFKARLLQAYFAPGTHYDDIGVCNSMGVYRGGTNPIDEEEKLINGTKGDNVTNFKIYPNPSDGQITIDYNLLANQKGKIIIVDILGRQLDVIHLDAKATKVTTEVNFAPGIYLAKFMVDNKLSEVRKLVIQ